MNTGIASSLEELHHFAHAESGKFSWPTLGLAIGTITTIIIASALAVTGVIPLWAAGVVNLIGFCAGYTVGHEVIHNNMIGRHRNYRWLNVLFGTLFFSIPFHSLCMHTFIHTRHHRYTNNRQKDPDAWIDGTNPFTVLFRIASHAPHYIYYVAKASKELPNRKTFLLRCAAEQGIPVLIAIGLIMAGYGKEVLIVWVAPALFVYPILAFFLDWLPHHKLGEGAPFESTRLLGAPQGPLGRIMGWLYLYQNYHLIHHLYPRVPWHRMRLIFEHGREVLAKNGAKIHFR